jgi:hypothetical protein
MGDRGYYFSKDNADELHEIMTRFKDESFTPILPDNNHEERLVKFANDFIKIFDFKSHQ